MVASLVATSTDPASGLDSTGLSYHDQWRYVVTYCHLVRKESFAKHFSLATGCSQRVKFFAKKICVKDPEDDDTWVPQTCLNLDRVHAVAEIFCPRTTTTSTTTTATTTTTTATTTTYTTARSTAILSHNDRYDDHTSTTTTTMTTKPTTTTITTTTITLITSLTTTTTISRC